MTFEEGRAQFPVLERIAYLNAGSFGPLPRVAAEAMAEQARRDVEEGRGLRYFEAMLGARARVRDQIAATIAADAARVALTSSTTEGASLVALGLGLQDDDEVVTTDCEHFGLVGPLHASGATVRVVPVRERPPEEALDAILVAITPRTRLVAVSHVYWTTGHVLDVHALGHECNRPLLVDGAQSVGAIPVDVGALDFYTVSCQKWLCGPDTTGALYVRDPEALRVTRPSMFGQESFEPSGEFMPRAGAARFDPVWLPVAALHGLSAAIDVAPEWRYERVRELAARCREALIDAGVDVFTLPGHAGLVTFTPKGDPKECAREADARGVVIRDLPGTPWVRASCGWWNNDDDIERLVGVVA